MKQSKIIAITGSIASGKSQVTNFLKQLSYKVIDSDIISRDIINEREVIEKIKSYFGENLYSKGVLDRSALASIIFNDREKRDLLDSITHPLIYKRISEKIQEYKREKIVFVDIPLLIENGTKSYDMDFDEIWLVYADKETQIRRLMSRDNISYDYANIKISSQMSMEEKKKYADIILDNRGDLNELKDKVLKALNRLNK